MEGGQSSTYLRLTRASSGPRVSVAKTYRDENKTKMNISVQTQMPSSAVEHKVSFPGAVYRNKTQFNGKIYWNRYSKC